MDATTYWEVIGAFFAIQAASVAFVEIRYRGIVKRVDEKLGFCQKLCGNEMKHLSDNIKELKESQKPK